jgi:hypothetical protein
MLTIYRRPRRNVNHPADLVPLISGPFLAPDGEIIEINPFDSPSFAVLIREANERGQKPGA